MGAGRPTTYDDAIPSMVLYPESYGENGDVVPTVEGLCIAINRGRSTVYRWAEDKEKVEIRDTLERIKEIQAAKLINGGLSNELNSTITKLMLANHGYHDKVETDHKSSDGSMTPERKTLDDFYSDTKS